MHHLHSEWSFLLTIGKDDERIFYIIKEEAFIVKLNTKSSHFFSLRKNVTCFLKNGMCIKSMLVRQAHATCVIFQSSLSLAGLGSFFYLEQ